MPEKLVSCHTADIDNEKDPLHTERVFSRYALITWRNAVSLGQSLVHDLGGLGEHLVQSLRGFEALGVHLVDVLGAGRTGGEPVVLGGDLQTADLGVVARSLGELGGDVLAGQLGGLDVVTGELGELLLLLCLLYTSPSPRDRG